MRFVTAAELPRAWDESKSDLFLVGEVQEANCPWLPHLSSEKRQVPGEGDPVHLVPVPAARREREKPREAREDTSSSGGSEVTSWPLIPPARGIWVSGEAQLRATSLPPLSLEIRFLKEQIGLASSAAV